MLGFGGTYRTPCHRLFCNLPWSVLLFTWDPFHSSNPRHFPAQTLPVRAGEPTGAAQMAGASLVLLCRFIYSLIPRLPFALSDSCCTV